MTQDIRQKVVFMEFCKKKYKETHVLQNEQDQLKEQMNIDQTNFLEWKKQIH